MGLAGLVGSGRTEVARAIFGADPTTGGTIRLDGEEVRIGSPRKAVQLGVALLPESRKSQGLLMGRSIAENVTLPHLELVSRHGNMLRRVERAYADDLIRRVDVRTPNAAVPVYALSGGNQQKVLFAKWLLHRPRVLIADEPTRGVDVGAKRAIYELLQSLAADGMAVLLISSELEEVLGLAHRVLVMRGGEIVKRLDGDGDHGRCRDQRVVRDGAGARGRKHGMSTPDQTVGGARVDFHRLKSLSVMRDYGIVAVFVALFVVLSLASPVFFSRVNLLNILDQWSATLIIAVAGTLVLIAGGFDLSVGSIYAFSGVIAALTVGHIGAWGAILLGVAAGLGCGVVNGIIATWGRINPFIATLATSIMIGGFALVLTGGNLISVLDNGHFTVLGRSDFETIKYSVWTLLAFTLLCGYLLSRTTYGRRVYASGGNPEAARLSGVRVNLVKASTFALSGTAAGIAGVIVSSRVATGQADSGGLGIALDAVAGIVIGGTSILGGAGAIWRTVLGVLLLAMIGNGFNLLNVNSTYQRIFQGAIIVFAVGVDAWSRRSA